MLVRYVSWVIEATLVQVDESNMDNYRSQRAQSSLLGGGAGNGRTLLWMDYEHAGPYLKFVSNALKPVKKGAKAPQGCGFPLIVEVTTGDAYCRGAAEMLKKYKALCTLVPAPPLETMTRHAVRLGVREYDRARALARECEGDVRAMELRIRMGAGSSKDTRYDMFGVINALESSTDYTDYVQEGVRQLIGTSGIELYLRPSIKETLEEWSTLDLYRYRGSVFDDITSRSMTLNLSNDMGGHRLSRQPIRNRDPMVLDPPADARLAQLRQELNKTFTCAL
tara:strand:- start:2641 stop:3480 length:840 start_codon:yes stop_codon:yes gene_type:complete